MKSQWDISHCGLNCAQCNLYLIPDKISAAIQILEWFKKEKCSNSKKS